ncbi:MAG: acyl-CoA dehydratase activase [Spirochaetia bacterium]|jgi:predicted CoA-substrate-specific enzyme activase|nr:acyl-CoA dehydratase activase [Spirochaetia bacterium]
MIAYVCKYTPIEVFQAMGEETILLEGAAGQCTEAESCMHPNLCSYAKAAYETLVRHPEYEGIILTSCCDSINRLYDNLCRRFPKRFIYLLDLPRKVNDSSVMLYRRQIALMAEAWEAYKGEIFDPVALQEYIGNGISPIAEDAVASESKDRLRIGIMGARCSKNLYRLLKADRIVFDLTCAGIGRSIRKLACDDILTDYARSLLEQLPCMRMCDVTRRLDLVRSLEGKVDGIIYHVIKFCDLYPYEYSFIKKEISVPVNYIETDGTESSSGQLQTRIEAFEEELQARRNEGEVPVRLIARYKHHHDADRDEKIRSKGYFLGIDSGSTSTNAVVIDNGCRLLASCVIPTGAQVADSAAQAKAMVLGKAGIGTKDVCRIVSTGYGRNGIVGSDQDITEISCHAKGVHFLFPDVRTILDIGGQDSKAIRINEAGSVVDFVMNDKCAAGTGRFLEMISSTLDIGLEEMGPLSLTSKKDVEISSMCSVFAESEVISLVAENKELADIIHGVHKTIAKKGLALMKRVGLESEYCMSGGVARNVGVVEVLSQLLDAPVKVYGQPDIVGALGAALFARQKHLSTGNSVK